jgi:hypothetical protein
MFIYTRKSGFVPLATAQLLLTEVLLLSILDKDRACH